MATREDRPVFSQFRTIKGYRIKKRIGQGGFGDVYLVEYIDGGNHDLLAMKTEYLDAPKQALEREVELLSEIQGPWFPKIYAHGVENDCRWYVMDLYGPAVNSIRLKMPLKTFNLQNILILAEETLRIIYELHAQGYVHRDIKPSNFLLRPRNPYPLVLIDYGLSKRYINPDTNKPYPNVNGKYCGTMKYASPNAFHSQQLGPVDDLYSWFYMLAEMSLKRLPWASVKDREQNAYEKEYSISSATLCTNLPSQFIQIYDYIKKLKYEDVPDYLYLFRQLKDVRESENCYPSGNEWKNMWLQDPTTVGQIPRQKDDSQYETYDPEKYDPVPKIKPARKKHKKKGCIVM